MYTGQTESATRSYGGKLYFPVLSQLRRRKWKWLEQTVRRSDDSEQCVVKHVLRWAPQGHQGQRTLGGKSWKKKSVSKLVNISLNFFHCLVAQPFQYSWRKMEAAANDRARWRGVVSCVYWQRQGNSVFSLSTVSSSTALISLELCHSLSEGSIQKCQFANRRLYQRNIFTPSCDLVISSLLSHDACIKCGLCPYVVSVCVSVCLSRSYILSKRKPIVRLFHRRVDPSFQCSQTIRVRQQFDGDPLIGPLNTREYEKNHDF